MLKITLRYLFQCRHPWARLSVERREALVGLDDEGRIETRLMSMRCEKCGRELEKKYATLTSKGRKDWDELTKDVYPIIEHRSKNGHTI